VYKDNFKVSKSDYEDELGTEDDEGGKLFKNTDTNGRFHSDWLSMMYERLLVARDLLTDDGVIFMSIDDNEAHNLRKIADEIFGEENLLGNISNTNNPKGRSDDKFIATAHEYISVYSKDISRANLYGFEPDERIVKRYNKKDEKGKLYREIDLRKTGDSDRQEDRPDMFYYFYFDNKNNTLRVSKENNSTKSEIQIFPKKDDDSNGRWRWGFKTAQEKLKTVHAKFMPSRKIWGIFEKDYLDGRPPVKATSSWSFKDVNSERGSEEFIKLGFKKEIFERPKPVGTLSRCIELGLLPNSNEIVLDFSQVRHQQRKLCLM
jgi:adenine-specific DNA-methyltransferase